MPDQLLQIVGKFGVLHERKGRLHDLKLQNGEEMVQRRVVQIEGFSVDLSPVGQRADGDFCIVHFGEHLLEHRSDQALIFPKAEI